MRDISSHHNKDDPEIVRIRPSRHKGRPQSDPLSFDNATMNMLKTNVRPVIVRPLQEQAFGLLRHSPSTPKR
jgi:hypothetical protein